MYQTNASLDLKCLTTCKHKECQKHAYIEDNKYHGEKCQCLGQVNASSLFYEHVSDFAKTLAQIMANCGMHECRAKSTIEISIGSLLYYDRRCYCLSTIPTKHLRKRDLVKELIKNSMLKCVDAQKAYIIIKHGFKAFYHNLPANDSKDANANVCPVSQEESIYKQAAKRTAADLARQLNWPYEQQSVHESSIHLEYKRFCSRMKKRLSQAGDSSCNCCYCARKRGHLIFVKEPPCESSAAKKKRQHVCQNCCHLKDIVSQKIAENDQPTKCPLCHCPYECCKCKTFENAHAEFVKSIWDRADMQEYYDTHIENPPEVSSVDSCDDWFDPKWVRNVIGALEVNRRKLCKDWFDPFHVKCIIDPQFQYKLESSDENPDCDSSET